MRVYRNIYIYIEIYIYIYYITYKYTYMCTCRKGHYAAAAACIFSQRGP